jgi:predicted DsbA family dithiol-disulfide isomerase
VSEPKSVSVDFFADLVCPWCYVGWEALKRAAEARPGLALNLAWRNFLLDPATPRDGYDRRAYLESKFTDVARRNAIHDALRAAAQAAGATLRLDAPERMPNTIDAHRLIHWAAGQQRAEAAIDALFSAYWIHGRDIGEGATLARIAGSIGLDPALVLELLAGDSDRDTIARLHNSAIKLGVTGVPLVILNGKALVMGAQSPEDYGKALDQVAG